MTIMLISAILISTLLILLSYTISHKNNYPIVYSSVNDNIESRSQYECGLEPFEEELGIETRERFYIKFYIVGILFLIFDLETLLLLPGSLLFFNSSLSSTLTLPLFSSYYANVITMPTSSQFSTYPNHFTNSESWWSGAIDLSVLREWSNGYKIFIVLFIFVLILILGLIYEYRKNVI